jgi:hypothetical protein
MIRRGDFLPNCIPYLDVATMTARVGFTWMPAEENDYACAIRQECLRSTWTGCEKTKAVSQKMMAV